MPENLEKPPEKLPEAALERPRVGSESQVKKAVAEAAVDEAPRAADALTPEVMKPTKDEQLAAIEKIMENNLKKVFGDMPEAQRIRFKQAGEKLAAELSREVRRPRLDARRVLERQERWLAMIPHVNRYFRIQEAACKTSGIVRMHEDLQAEREMGI